MNNRKPLAAAVAAITVLVGTVGMALWPSAAGASYPIRKFTGPISPRSDSQILEVSLHNPHATATINWEVVTRSDTGTQLSRSTGTVRPNAIVYALPRCNIRCSLEVNMNNALLQPSVRYYQSNNSAYEFLYAGDFSR